MKLYTEEQVREAYLSGMYVTVSFEEMLQRLSPIELPSDDEISISSKQTAVEWLVEKLDQNFDYVADTIIEQAKAMEKEQLIDAHYQGYRNNIGTTEVSEQYYNETYGK